MTIAAILSRKLYETLGDEAQERWWRGQREG